jgi:hypothetical protein
MSERLHRSRAERQGVDAYATTTTPTHAPLSHTSTSYFSNIYDKCYQQSDGRQFAARRDGQPPKNLPSRSHGSSSNDRIDDALSPNSTSFKHQQHLSSINTDNSQATRPPAKVKTTDCRATNSDGKDDQHQIVHDLRSAKHQCDKRSIRHDQTDNTAKQQGVERHANTTHHTPPTHLSTSKPQHLNPLNT